MSQIIVGFSRPNGGFQPFSWLIRLVTRSKFSHAYVKFYSQQWDRWIVYQASGLKVNFVGEPKFDAVEDIVAEFGVPVSDEAKLATVRFAVDHCGDPYSLGQAFGMLFVLGARILGKKIKNPFRSSSSFVCSELVATILDEFTDEKDDVDPSTMSPQDVYDFLIAKGLRPISRPGS